MTEILGVTSDHIREMRQTFDAKIREIEKMSSEVQRRIYAKFNGPIHFDMQVEKHFSEIRPWVQNWIAVQVPSIVQRELFGPSRSSLEVCILWKIWIG